MSIVLNGRTHEGVGPTFPEDFLAWLAAKGIVPSPGGPLPAVFDREFPVTIQLKRSLFGVRFRHDPGAPPTITAQWSFPLPGGGAHWMDVQVPEELRAKLAETSLTGDEQVDALYGQATYPVALAAFLKAWDAELVP